MHATSALAKNERRRSRLALILAPLFLCITLLSWAVTAAPKGSPDASFHLGSIYCADGEDPTLCMPTFQSNIRLVRDDAVGTSCYVRAPNDSAACIAEQIEPPYRLKEAGHLNINGSYPPVYYRFNHTFVGDDADSTIVTIRVANILIFTALASLVVALVRPERRFAMWATVAVTIVPLGLFTIASINPSAWSLYTPALAFFAVAGAFESSGWRRYALVGLGLLCVGLAAGARSDAGAYAILGVACATFLMIRVKRIRPLWAVGGVAILAAIFWILTQTSQFQYVAGERVSRFFDAITSGTFDGSQSRFDIISNIENVPSIWTGSLGTWALGSFDVKLPQFVSTLTIFAFGAMLIYASARIRWRGVLLTGIVFALMIILPVFILFQQEVLVGHWVQPRYIMPLLVLLMAIPAWHIAKGRVLTTPQRWMFIVTLGVAQAFALRATINRYAYGNDEIIESSWWRDWAPGPRWVLLLGSLSFVLFLATVFLALSPVKNPQAPAGRDIPRTIPLPRSGSTSSATFHRERIAALH